MNRGGEGAEGVGRVSCARVFDRPDSHTHVHTPECGTLHTHSCPVYIHLDVMKYIHRCPQEIPSKRDYHPGHQQSDLSQGGEEVEVNPTSDHTKSSAPSYSMCVSMRERDTHSVTQQHRCT